MSTIKKRKGFSLITTIFIFLFIGAVLAGTVMLLDTSDTGVVNNNQQIQAREICIAALEVMFDHMENAPSDYEYALSDPENINFTAQVNIPFAVYGKDETNTYLNDNDYFTDTIVDITVVGDPEKDGQLIATAHTDYALTDTEVKLEILYNYSDGTYKFQKGRFLN